MPNKSVNIVINLSPATKALLQYMIELLNPDSSNPLAVKFTSRAYAHDHGTDLDSVEDKAALLAKLDEELSEIMGTVIEEFVDGQRVEKYLILQSVEMDEDDGTIFARFAKDPHPLLQHMWDK